MSAFDELILKVKRRDNPAARLMHDAYRRLMALDVPDTMATRVVFGTAYAGFRLWGEASEVAASKCVYAPMLRARSQEAGPNLHVTARPYIRGHAKIRIGQGCTFHSFNLRSGRFLDDPEILFGDGCVVGEGVLFALNRRIEIGRRVGIAERVDIQDSDGHPADPEARMRGETALREEDIAPVTIHDDAWIGRDCHILKGVTIGRGAVVATGSVVVSDVPDGAVALGVPARVVRKA
jgi:acetyltransferase-like isoleucine patch superfamily enzyme